MKVLDLTEKPLPKALYFNGVLWTGETGIVNGFNGYKKTEHHGMVCAVVSNSLFSKGKPNLLTDKDGNFLCAEGKIR